MSPSSHSNIIEKIDVGFQISCVKVNELDYQLVRTNNMLINAVKDGRKTSSIKVKVSMSVSKKT